MKLLAVFDNSCLALSLLGVSLFFTAILLNNLNLCIYLCDEFCFPYIYACHSALRLVGQEPEPSQAPDMALAWCCCLGKVLGAGCHYFPPPLDIPTFAARYLHVCTTRRRFGIFYMPKSTTWDRRLYFPSEKMRTEDFFALKTRRLRPGLNPRTRVPEASTLNPRPPKPMYTSIQCQVIFVNIVEFGSRI